MGWVLRKYQDKVNPTLPGGVYNYYITSGRGVYYRYDSSTQRNNFILFISDGGRYGMCNPYEVSYDGNILPENQYKFHPGILTPQINPYPILEVIFKENQLKISVSENPTFAYLETNDPVRFSCSGQFPGGLSKDKKYYIKSKEDGPDEQVIKLSLEPDGEEIELTTDGTGILRIWLANTGFDDSNQGLPSFCPEVNTTFSGICYIDGWFSSTENQEPDWANFRVVGKGRKLMDFDSSGADTSLVSSGYLLGNAGLIIRDILKNSQKRPDSKIDWESLFTLREKSSGWIWENLPSSLITSTGVTLQFGILGQNDYLIPLYIKRNNNINLVFGSGSPGGTIPNGYFWYLVTGYIKAPVTGTYTFSLETTRLSKLTIDNQIIVEAPDGGTYNGTIDLIQDTLYLFEIEAFHIDGTTQTRLYWEYPGQSIQDIPQSQLVPSHGETRRYVISLASANPTESSDVLDQVFDRCPGCNFTEISGKFTVLFSDRAVDYVFDFDFEDDEVESTILEGTFQQNKRHPRERPNFVLFSYRDINETGYPEKYVEINRPALRQNSNVQPGNETPSELGVMSEGLAQRIANLEAILKSDPIYTYSLESDRISGKVNKASLILLRNFVRDNIKIAEEYCLVTNVSRSGSRINFSLLPIPKEFYLDYYAPVPVVTEPPPPGGGQNSPTNLSLIYDDSLREVTISWTNNGATGMNIVERKRNNQNWIQIDSLSSSTNSYLDNNLFQGFYSYRVKNNSVMGYTNEESVYIEPLDGGGI